MSPSPPPSPSPSFQRHKRFIYATAHKHDVDGQTVITDGKTPVIIDAGFEVAPASDTGIEVANSRMWGCLGLVFSDGAVAGSALNNAQHPSDKGTACSFYELFHNLMSMSGKSEGSGHLKVDSQGRVSAKNNYEDVLLRKRA
jgi:hypothetical protein